MNAFSGSPACGCNAKWKRCKDELLGQRANRYDGELHVKPGQMGAVFVYRNILPFASPLPQFLFMSLLLLFWSRVRNE